MKTFKLILKIALYQAISIFLSFVLVLFMTFLINRMALASIITTFFYAVLMYSAGWNEGRRDVRKLPGCEPSVKKAVRASLIFCCIPLALLIFRVICPFAFPMQWQPYGEGYTMQLTQHWVTQIADAIYRIFFFPCIGFLQNGALLNYFLPILIVPVMVLCGYLVGLRRFSILEQCMPKLFYKTKQGSDREKRK